MDCGDGPGRWDCVVEIHRELKQTSSQKFRGSPSPQTSSRDDDDADKCHGTC